MADVTALDLSTPAARAFTLSSVTIAALTWCKVTPPNKPCKLTIVPSVGGSMATNPDLVPGGTYTPAALPGVPLVAGTGYEIKPYDAVGKGAPFYVALGTAGSLAYIVEFDGG